MLPLVKESWFMLPLVKESWLASAGIYASTG